MRKINKKLIRNTSISLLIGSIVIPTLSLIKTTNLKNTNTIVNHNFLTKSNLNVVNQNNKDLINSSNLNSNKTSINENQFINVFVNKKINSTQKRFLPNKSIQQQEFKPEFSNLILKDLRQKNAKFSPIALPKNNPSGKLNFNFNDFENSKEIINDANKGNANEIKNDLNLFAYLFWKNNSSNLKIKNTELLKLEVQNKNNNQKKDLLKENNFDLYFDKTFLTFNFNIYFTAVRDTILNISTEKIYLSKNSDYVLEIGSTKQLIRPSVSKINKDLFKELEFKDNQKDFFVSWKINDANFKVKKSNSTQINDNKNNYKDLANLTHEFTPTLNVLPSKSFSYFIDNLSDKRSYLALFNKYQSQISQIPAEKIKSDIETQVDNNIEAYFYFLDASNILFKSISSLDNFANLIVSISTPILKALSNLNILPSFLSELLVYLLDKPEAKELSFIEFLSRNKQEILIKFGKKYPNELALIKPLFVTLRENQTEQDNEFNDIDKKLLKDVPSEFKDFLKQKLFGINEKNPLPLIDFLTQAIPKLLSSNDLKSYLNSDLAESLGKLINELTQKTNFNNYISIWSALYSKSQNDSNVRSTLVKLILDASSSIPNISKILKILLGDTNHFEMWRLKKVIDKISIFLDDFFKINPNYVSIENKYVNLKISKYFQKFPTINKQTSKISFDYRFNINIRKKIVFDIESIKSLITSDGLLGIFGLQSNVSKWIPPFIKDWARSLVFNFIPPKLVFGERENLITIKSTANNSSFIFKPVKDGGIYNFGYQFVYENNFFMQDPGFIQNILSNFSENYTRYWIWVGTADFYYAAFWKSIIQNILLRDYSFTSKFIGYEHGNIVASADDFDEDLAIPGFIIRKGKDNLSNSQIADLFDPNKHYSNVKFNIDKRRNNFSWNVNDADLWYGKNKENKWYEANSKIYGHKPQISKELKEKIKDSKYDLGFGTIYLSDENREILKPYFNIDALLNFKASIRVEASPLWIPIKVWLDINMMQLNSHLFLPFKYFDESSNKMVDNFSESISNFKAFLNLGGVLEKISDKPIKIA